MASVTQFITLKLRLKVNQTKSAVARPWERKFLGFSFSSHRKPRWRIAPQALVRFKERVRELTRRTRAVSIERMAKDLTRYLRGWIGYFGKCETPGVLRGLEEWIRHRLRSVIWTQWKRGKVRYAELRTRGVRVELGPQKRRAAPTAHGGWRKARPSPSHCPMPTSTRSGFRDWLHADDSTRRTARYVTRMPGGVTGKAGDCLPMSIFAQLTEQRAHAVGKPVLGILKQPGQRTADLPNPPGDGQAVL